MHILLVGQGKMGRAVALLCEERNIRWTDFGSLNTRESHDTRGMVAIHFGGGRDLNDLIGFCVRNKVPLIQGSTILVNKIPTKRNLVIISAANLSIPMMRLISALPTFAEVIGGGMNARILESHQSTKSDVSGTAREMAELLGIPETDIESVRDGEKQIRLGIPKEHLGGHAHHEVIFSGSGTEIKVSTQILGRQPYAEGGIAIAEAILRQKEPLPNGVYRAEQILKLLTH